MGRPVTGPMKPTDPLIGPPRGDAETAFAWAVGAGAKRIDQVQAYISEVYALAPLIGLDPAVAVAASGLESGDWGALPGQGGVAWVQRLNPASIGITSNREGDPDIDLGYEWPDGAAAARAQLAHLFAYYYADLPYWDYWNPRVDLVLNGPNAGTVRTIQDLAGKYAMTPDYGQRVADRGNLIYGGFKETPPVAGIAMQTIQVAGLGAVQIPAGITFRQEIIPKSQTNQRPGHAFYGGSASYYTQHETGNPRAGTGAAMHSRYMHQGAIAYDQNGRPYSQQLGYHFTNDDTEIVQMIPVNENAWHAGDSGGNGNFDSIANELCVNEDADKARARWIAEWLCAAITEAMQIAQANIKQHGWWSGKDCPAIIRRENYWTTYLANVARNRTTLREGGTAPEPFAKPVILDLGTWDGTDRTLPDGTVMQACKRTLTARTTTKRYQLAATDAPSIGPDLKKGDQAPILYVFQAQKGGARWAYTEWGTRLRLAHFTPYVTLTPKE